MYRLRWATIYDTFSPVTVSSPNLPPYESGMNLGGIEVNGVADDLGQGKAKETTFPPFAISSRTSRSYESGMSVGDIEVGGVMDDLGQGKNIETHFHPLKLFSEHPLPTYRDELWWYRKQRSHRRPRAREIYKKHFCAGCISVPSNAFLRIRDELGWYRSHGRHRRPKERNNQRKHMFVGCNFLPLFPFLRTHSPCCKQGGAVVVVVGVAVAVVGVAGDAGVVIVAVVVAAIGLALVVLLRTLGFLAFVSLSSQVVGQRW